MLFFYVASKILRHFFYYFLFFDDELNLIIKIFIFYINHCYKIVFLTFIN
jgi:hypothetical protein